MSGKIGGAGEPVIIGRGTEVVQHHDMKTVDTGTDLYASNYIITGNTGSGWNPNSHALVWFTSTCYTTSAAGNGADLFITGSGIGSTTSGHKSCYLVGYYAPSYMLIPCAGQVLTASPVGTSTPRFEVYLDQSTRTERYNNAWITLECMEVIL